MDPLIFRTSPMIWIWMIAWWAKLKKYSNDRVRFLRKENGGFTEFVGGKKWIKAPGIRVASCRRKG